MSGGGHTVRNVAWQARGKLTALYRTTHFYNVVQMINQYMCHILPMFESNTMALLERCYGRHLEMLKIGLFGVVEVFNKLPEEVVRLLDVMLSNGH